jgi:hypothetical protein
LLDKFIIRKTIAGGTNQYTRVQPIPSARSAQPKIKSTPYSGNIRIVLFLSPGTAFARQVTVRCFVEGEKSTAACRVQSLYTARPY